MITRTVRTDDGVSLALHRLDPSGRLGTPVLAIAGSRDWVFAPASTCRDLVNRMGGDAKTFAVARLDHRGLLLDPRADGQCWPLLADWLARLFPAGTPSARAAR